MRIDPHATVLRLAELRLHRRVEAARGSGRFPRRDIVERAFAAFAEALYPARLARISGDADYEDRFVAGRIVEGAALIENAITDELAYWQREARAAFDNDQAATIVRLFVEELPEVRALIDSDIEAAFLGDPAARSLDEVLICYPGALAMLHHRIAHILYALGAPIVARILSELANARTGIDIHPGATIGAGCFIDHGTGVVIGETAILGERVRLYQHVTLGARSPLGLTPAGPRERHARHPIVEDDVIVYAGATILGRVTIGRGSIIGGNTWLLDDVPPGSVVAQPTASVLPLSAARDMHERLHGKAG